MAFDYGSIDLGLKNPFKKEGVATAIRGAIQVLLAVYLLVEAVGYVQTSKLAGWLFVAFGTLLLGIGIKALGSGIYAMLRYFVGRNHPTSLAYNYSKSESSTAKEEAGSVAYSGANLEEMLVGRKNSTFVEPVGFLARLLHSFVPKLLFMPYPVRNLMQRLFGAWVKTLVALIAYAFVAFVSLTGLAGTAGEVAFPVYSIILLIYLVMIWTNASRPLSRRAELHIEALGSGTIVRVVIWSLISPVVVAMGLNYYTSQTNTTLQDIADLQAQLPTLHASLYLFAIFALSCLGTGLIVFMLRKRLKHVSPTTEVSELRENWQESVHPNEIFINLDNLVMANRRYQEVPNRVYHELDPELDEQVEGKGGFRGKMVQEIQPKFRAMQLGKTFDKIRMITLISGNVLFVIASVLFFILSYVSLEAYTDIERIINTANSDNLDELVASLMPVLHLVLGSLIILAFARLLVNAVHVFFAELQFESLLIYFKCEGTFTESKISTGAGIHDSTRSENTLVRSSITPWIIVSRIVSTTFAATGMRNLEYPRYIQEMHKDDQELAGIRADVIEFLKDRESIATITSSRDLGNASQIHELNQQTRAYSESYKSITKEDEEAAGYLRHKDFSQSSDNPL